MALAATGVETADRVRRRLISRVAAILLGVSGVVLMVTTGSALWGVVRVVVVVALAAGLLWTQGRSDRISGWAAVGVGILALPVTGAIAVDHLAATGGSLRSVAAIIAAASSAVLLAAGTVRLVRASRGWRRLRAIPVALVLAQFVLVPLTMATIATNRAPAPLGADTPADRGLDFRDVTLETADGVELAGWYVPSRNGAAVLLRHGSGSTRTATLAHAEVLAGLGYGVLALDARGHGASDGTPMALGWYGNADLARAVDWLAAQPDVRDSRIGAVGLSMGGEEALTLAAVDPRVRAVVAEGVGVRVAGDVPPGPDDAWLPRTVNAWTTAMTDVLTAASPPPPLDEVVAGIEPPCRVLIIAGEGEEAQARWLVESSRGNVDLWEPPGAGHIAGLATHPAEWQRRVAALLAQTLGATAGG